MKRIIALLLPLFLLIACNKQAITDLQARIDTLEKVTLANVQSQMAAVRSSLSALDGAQKELSACISELQRSDASLKDITAALQEQQKSFGAELEALRKSVEDNAADVRKWMDSVGKTLQELGKLSTRINEINQYLQSVENRLSGFGAKVQSLEDALGASQKGLDSLKESLLEMQEDMTEIREQIAALVSSVQSVVVVPDFTDGSVEIRNLQANRLYFEIYPLSAAELLARLGASAVSLDAVETSTRAGEKRAVNFPVSETSFNGTYFTVVADCSSLDREFFSGARSANARLRISDGAVTRSSEYFPLVCKIDPSTIFFTWEAEPVDLGLSVKWSAYNLGADRPEGYGAIFSWGETEPKQTCVWETYKWSPGQENKVTKYCLSEEYGPVDGKSVLDPEDDAAHVKLGEGWRIPTRAEIEELMASCQWTWTKNYNGTGVSGYIVTGQKSGFEDKSIFLPTAGYIGNVGPQYAGSNGSYWSSELFNPTATPVFVYCLAFDFLKPYWGSGYRFHGRSIRPVTAE